MSGASTVETIFRRFWQPLQEEMELAIPLGGDVAAFMDMLRYHLGWQEATPKERERAAGKRLRPILCLLACEAVGGSPDQALSAAAAIELLHNFTLIHDDVQDISPERRHRATVWSIWGVNQAINAGDALYALAHLALLRLLDRGVASDKVIAAARSLNTACLLVCEGQYLDVAFEERLDVTEAEYLAMIRRKTGALIACALELGASIGGAEPTLVESLGRFGENLGLAFQIQDDVLGVWGAPALTGKPAADDIRQRKKTLPVIYALNRRDFPATVRLATLYGKAGLAEDEVQEVTVLLDELGAKEYALERAQAFYREALSYLQDALGDERSRDLRLVVDWLIGRSF